MSAHTPGPWTATDYDVHGPNGEVIANMAAKRGMPDAANAAQIVRCVNAHDELVAALQGLLADPYLSDPINNDRMAAARTAIARATGGQP